MGCKTPVPSLLLIVIAVNIIFLTSVTNASCDCKRTSSTCVISDPPSYGYKCKCTSRLSGRFFFACSGESIRCGDTEYCPSNDASYCACKRGGGECFGYNSNSDNCNDIPCDCNKSREWRKSQFVIDSVTYHTQDTKVTKLGWVTLAEKNIDNNSPETQIISLTVNEKFTETYSYSRTSGTEIQTGVSFTASFPYVEGVSTSASRSFTESQSRTFGRSESHQVSYSTKFSCNGSEFAKTLCKVQLQKGKVEVPYTMKIKPKYNLKCACESKGVWKGSFTYYPQIKVSVLTKYPHSRN